MAPRTKRTAASDVPPAAKKERRDPNVAGVVEGLDMTDLPQSCRRMLIASIPQGLAIPGNERGPAQLAAVRMIGEALCSVQARLEGSVESEGARLDEARAMEVQLQRDLAQAGASAAEAEVVLAARTAALAEVAHAAAAAKEDHSRTQEAQRCGDADFLKAKGLLEAFAAGLNDHFPALCEGTGWNSAHDEALQPLLEHLALDASLRSALRSTCSKAAAERGPFDGMVVEQLGTHLREKVAACARAVEEGAPEAAARAATVQDAEAAVAEATHALQGLAEEMRAAEGQLQVALASVRAAQDAVATHQARLAAASAAREARAEALESFKVYNMGCFEVLRSATKLPDVAAADEAPVAAAAGA